MGADLSLENNERAFEEIRRVLPGYGDNKPFPRKEFRTHDGKAHFAPFILDPALFPALSTEFDTIALHYSRGMEKALQAAKERLRGAMPRVQQSAAKPPTC